MISPLDRESILQEAALGASAPQIIEKLGLPVSERTVQRVIRSRFGSKPKLSAMKRVDPVRQVLVKLMTRAGKDPRTCSRCGRRGTRPLAIRATCANPDDVNDLVFVCVTRCATVADA